MCNKECASYAIYRIPRGLVISPFFASECCVPEKTERNETTKKMKEVRGSIV